MKNFANNKEVRTSLSRLDRDLKLRISIANLLLLICSVAIAIAWLSDRQQLQREIIVLQNKIATSGLRNSVAERDYYKRLDGVRLLISDGAIENFPSLIFAISDPDIRIAVEARNGLEKLTGKKMGIASETHATMEDCLESFRTERLEWETWFGENHPEIQYQFSPVYIVDDEGIRNDDARSLGNDE